MKYTRIYADSDGETHFEDIEEETQKVEIAPTAILDVGKARPTSECFLASFPRGYSDDFHPPPNRLFITVLEGELETTVSDGEVRRFKAGDVLILEDVASKGHKNVVVGQSAFEFFMVFLQE